MELGDAAITLADKLGIALTEITSINAKFCVTQSITLTVTVFLVVITTCVTLYLVYKRILKSNKEMEIGDKLEDEDFMLLVFTMVLVIIISFIVFMALGSLYLHITNPDYYAIQETLRSISSII